ncbi:MAG: adenylate kinase [Chloroflexota bacterium]|nr:adenylate kinase [Chloroflexota bacterium]
MDLVLLGPPGAGKGTQAELLSDWLDIPAVSTGDLFRKAMAESTELGVQAKGYIERGDLVPDEVTVGMVRERLTNSDCDEGVILDGFPRTVPQADALEALLVDMGRRLDAALYIEVSRDELLRRLGERWTCRECGEVYHEIYDPPEQEGVCDKCGGELYQRSDDTPEAQEQRVKVYLEQTAPLYDYYAEDGLLIEIDGEQEIDAVQQEIREAISRLKGD